MRALRLVVVAAVSWTLLAPASALADNHADRLFRISDERIAASGDLAGLATSTLHGGIVYATGETGGPVYALNGFGTVVAELRLDQTEPRGWEALASGPEQRIWVADIGDEQGVRDEITLYRFREPASLQDQGVLWSRFRLVYPDGRHDAQALLVHPQTGQGFVVTAEASGGGIYAGPEELATSEGTNKLTRVADAPPLITDGAFLPDGSGVVLLSDIKAYVYDYPSWDKRGELPTPVQPPGATLTVTSNGGAVLVGTAGPGSSVYQVPMTALADTVEPAATPTPTSNPPEGEGGATQSVQDWLDSLLGGIPWWIPAGALGIAALAGIAAFPRSRRLGN